MSKNSLSRRQMLLAMAAVASSSKVLAQDVPTKKPNLSLYGPFASVSNPLIHLAKTNPLSEQFANITFKSWNNPDQLRAISVNKSADFIATPTNVAANLYNKGIPVKLVNVSVWGILWIVSRDEKKTKITDFEGEELLVPFRGDMPDLVLQLVAKQAGMQIGKDIKFKYVSTPMDIAQMLIMRRASHALLPEPMISMILRKTHQLPQKIIAPDLFRSTNIQQEWGRLYKRPARIPQAGVMALGDRTKDTELINQFVNAYKTAQDWCFANRQQCGEEVAKQITMLLPEAVADSLQNIDNIHMTAIEAKSELEFFFDKLMQLDSGLIGGALPKAEFYL